MNTFEPRAAVRFGWETFKKRPTFFTAMFLLISLLSNLTVQTEASGDIEVTAGYVLGMVVMGIILAIVSTVAKMGGNAFMLKTHDAPETVAFKDLWAPYPFWRFVGTMILRGVITGGPFAAAVLLGFFAFFSLNVVLMAAAFLLGVLAFGWLVYASIRFSFAGLIVMDQHLMPVQALKTSYAMTDGKFMLLVRLYTLFLGVALLGLLALIVGVVVAIPVISIAFTHAYKSLRSA